jgi:predicted metal-binding membrane protein
VRDRPEPGRRDPRQGRLTAAVAAAAAAVRRHGLPATALAALALAAWAFLVIVVADMSHPLARLMMPAAPGWTAAVAAAVVAMWAVMMAAMMLPSALPMVLVFAQLSRRGAGWAPTAAFVGAYVLAWSGFSLLAAGAHWGLQAAGLVSSMAASASPALTAGLLVGAGVFQLTPLKNACLVRCRSPAAFLMSHWRGGAAGGFRMGLAHGAFCVGCCWALMALLFAVGVMNLPFVALLSLGVAVEKLAPGGVWIARAIGAGLIIAGGLVLL